MKCKIVFAIMGLVLLGVNEIFAQSYAEEALFISRIQPGGSARIQAMGGVQTALGGDVSSAYYNPAGLGMYNRSDFSITPGYTIAGSSSSYLGNTTSASQSNLIIPNFGIAFHTNKDGNKGFWGGTFAVNFNRINDFNNTFSYTGRNTNNSIIDSFINNARGADTLQFESNSYNYDTPTGLAYRNFLIGPKSILGPGGSNTDYFTDVSGIPIQSETVKTSGAQNQWSFSYGVNFSDKFFVGAGIGLTTLNYKSSKTYTEEFPDANQPMSKMVLNESLSLTGNGINATIGGIYRPIDKVQFGFSVATPTSYSINDNYNAAMSTTWKNFQYYPGYFLNDVNSDTRVVNSQYNLSTPWRLSGGATFFLQKKGFVSADVEWINYAHSSYSSNTQGVDYSDDNTIIKGLYKSSLNIRVGGEYRLKDYRVRAGYRLMSDPYNTQQNNTNQTISSYSAGVGYRATKFYIDIAGVLGQTNYPYKPYDIATPVTVSKTSTSILVTVGFPF